MDGLKDEGRKKRETKNGKKGGKDRDKKTKKKQEGKVREAE